jgi:mitochondrial fission protein ELM1
MTTTTVIFTLPGYLPGTYSIEIEGDKFAALWAECSELEQALSVTSGFEAFQSWRRIKNRANGVALAALNDPKLESHFAEDPIRFVDDFELINQADEKNDDVPIIPWAKRFIYKHPFANGRELADLLQAIGWLEDAPVVVDTPSMNAVTGLQITEHAFYLF